MKSILLALGCVALVSLQGCCKKSEASPVGSSPDPTATASPVPVVETSKPQSQQRTYTMDRAGDGKNTYIRIKQIVVGPESTTVTVHLSNNTGTVMRGVSTSPPGPRRRSTSSGRTTRSDSSSCVRRASRSRRKRRTSSGGERCSSRSCSSPSSLR